MGLKMAQKIIKVSIGIMAYNEEANIGRLLARLLEQRTQKVKIEKILVVASGCTDRTEDIVRHWSQKNSNWPTLENCLHGNWISH